MDVIIIFLVMLGSLAGLAASAMSFGADSRNMDSRDRDTRGV